MHDTFAPIFFFATCVAIVWLVVNARMKRSQMEHEERMLAIEKGVALPERPMEKIRNPYKWPVIFIAVGVGMIAAMAWQQDEDFLWGCIPLLIGVGMIFSHRHLVRERQRHALDAFPPPLPPLPPKE